jgi:serine/threonine-protein kinase RsbW
LNSTLQFVVFVVEGCFRLYYERSAHENRHRNAAIGMTNNGRTIRLEFSSAFEMLDLVQIVSDAFGRLAGLDEEALHWMGVAIRESVINAINHGNRNDTSKSVFVEFAFVPASHPTELVVHVRDQGEGFDPSSLLDPLAPENLLKANGRGIFFMRSFMDDVSLRRMPEGGMEVRMVKKLPNR